MLFETFSQNNNTNQIDMRRVHLNLIVYSALNQMTSEIRRANGWNINTVNTWQLNYQLSIDSTVLTLPGVAYTFPIVTTADTGPLIVSNLSIAGDGIARLVAYNGTGTTATGQIIQSFNGAPPTTVQLSAGGWGWLNSFAYSGDTVNKFQILSDVSMASCILFVYDKTGDGIIHSKDQFGFRLGSENGYGVVQMRTGGTTFSCTPDANNTWVDITDASEVNISALQFTDAPLTVTASGKTLTQHQITVSMTANLINDTNAAETKDETVFVRNFTFDS